jgi:hypothetical protein
MTISRTLKIVGGWSTALAILLGVSYCSELPKYRFEQSAAEAARHIPGVRLIHSIRSVDAASPITWFWPATTTWNFAWPDPFMTGRFFTVTLVYDQENPIVFLVDADCEARELELYGLDQPENAFPARDVFGEPVVAPNGQTYRRLKTKQNELPVDWLHAFCDTDWEAERDILRQSNAK